jgi:hypothetical protein
MLPLDMATVAISPLVEEGNLKAIDRWLRISERRCRLLGLDKAPRPQMDILMALKILAENGVLPSQIATLASEELSRAADAILQSLNPLAA